MQSLCTLRDRCRQRPRNTRYQADATPYLGRTSTGWIAPACGWRTHSITSSARASSIEGTVRPSAFVGLHREIGWILRDRAFSRNSLPSAAHDVDGSLAAGFRRHLVSLRAATRTRRLYVGVSRGRIGGLLVKRDSGRLVGCDNRRIIIAVIAIVSVRPPTSITPVFGSAAEVAYPYPAQIAFTHRAAEMAFTHPPKMPTAHPAAEVASTTATTATAACKRVG